MLQPDLQYLLHLVILAGFERECARAALCTARLRGDAAVYDALALRHRGSNGIRTPLMHAAKHGYSERVSWLLERRWPADASDSAEMTALAHACAGRLTAGHVAVVQQLVAAGAAVNHVTRDGRTPLLLASESRNDDADDDVAAAAPAVVAALLAAGADVDARDEDGDTPLLRCAACGNAAVALVLLDAGADVLATNANGSSALQVASLCGHAALTELLCTAPAAAARIPPLHALVAASACCLPACMAAVLDRAEFSVDSWDNYGKTALVSACESAAHPAAAQVVALLLERGAGVNTADAYGRLPLSAACFRPHSVAVVRLLLAAGASVHTQDRYGKTAVQHALTAAALSREAGGDEEGDDTVVRLLLQAGAHVPDPGASPHIASEL